MSELLLDSLEIKGYRCFEHLTIEKLGRVNLIVGKNNVGKTALLEAVEIFFANHMGTDEFLSRRNEIRQDSKSPLSKLKRGDFNNLIFQQNKGNNSGSESFQIGKQGSPNKFSSEVISEENQDFSFISKHSISLKPGFEYLVKYLFIPLVGLSNNEIAQLWDSIVFTFKEDEIINALRLIYDKIERIAFVNYPDSLSNRIAIIKTSDSDFPVSLGRLGEGMNRLLGITVALVNCKGGILLVDEIESGLHYSALANVWKLIFKTAKDLNVQVFATTHSKDCIEAFTQAAIDDEESEGMLIRLERNKDDKIIAKTIEEENLALAIDYGAEVR
jgi:AAA15 family ATPase/GTPase